MMARRFVKRFASQLYNPIEDQITDYAETNNLIIVTIASLEYEMFVLFEEKEDGI